MIGFGSSPIELMSTDAMLRGEIFCEEFSYSAAWVTATATALGANATVDVQIQINSDSDFVIQEMNFTSTTAAGTFIAIPDYLIQIVVAGSGRQIMNQAQMISNVAGAYQNDRVPARLPMPKLLVANTTLTITLVNRTATAANRAELALRGYKVFYERGNRQQIFHVA